LPVVVATGLTSSLPMIPSSQKPGLVTWFAGPKPSPPEPAPAPNPNPDGAGERYMTSTLFPAPETGHLGAPGPISSETRKRLCPCPVPLPSPVAGLPSTAYHCRSTRVSGTPLFWQV